MNSEYFQKKGSIPNFYTNNFNDNTEEILVSITCTTFNHELYIKDAIESFLNQKTKFKYEIIIHDDASTDNTAKIISEYFSQYPNIIKLIIQKENQYSKGRKPLEEFVFPKTKGKYIAICEGDDYWIDPLKLQKQFNYLEENPNYNLVHSGFIALNGKKTQSIIIKHKIKEDSYIEYILNHSNPIATLTVFARKNDILLSLKEIEKIPFELLMGDLPLWLEMANISKFKYLEDLTATYRMLEESASHSKDPYKQVQFLENTLKIKLYYHKKFNIKINLNKIEHVYYRDIVQVFIGYKSQKAFYKYSRLAISKYPSLLLDLIFLKYQIKNIILYFKMILLKLLSRQNF